MVGGDEGGGRGGGGRSGQSSARRWVRQRWRGASPARGASPPPAPPPVSSGRSHWHRHSSSGRRHNSQHSQQPASHEDGAERGSGGEGRGGEEEGGREGGRGEEVEDGERRPRPRRGAGADKAQQGRADSPRKGPTAGQLRAATAGPSSLHGGVRGGSSPFSCAPDGGSEWSSSAALTMPPPSFLSRLLPLSIPFSLQPSLTGVQRLTAANPASERVGIRKGKTQLGSPKKEPGRSTDQRGPHGGRVSSPPGARTKLLRCTRTSCRPQPLLAPLSAVCSASLSRRWSSGDWTSEALWPWVRWLLRWVWWNGAATRRRGRWLADACMRPMCVCACVCARVCR